MVGAEDRDARAGAALGPATCGDDRTVGCEGHAVDTAVVAEVEDDLGLAERQIALDRVGPELSALIGWGHMGLRDIQRLFVLAE